MTAPSHDERLEDLAALCAAGAATTDEKRQLEAILASDPQALVAYREHRDAGALLAEALPPMAPPAGALDAIRERIARDPAQVARPSERAPTAPPAKPLPDNVIDLASRRRRTPMIVSSVSLVAAAAMALLWVRESRVSSDLENRLAAETQLRQDSVARERQTLARLGDAEGQLQTVSQKLDKAENLATWLQTPQVSLSTLGKSEDGPRVKIFVDPDKRRWLVYAYELPPISDKDYQLWFLSSDADAPVSAGVLQRRPDGVLVTEIAIPPNLQTIENAAISLEKKGGVTSPTLDQIKVSGKL